MATGQDLYMTKLREAEQRQREREAEQQRKEQAARQALDKGIAPADMTEDIVKAAMSPSPKSEVKPVPPTPQQPTTTTPPDWVPGEPQYHYPAQEKIDVVEQTSVGWEIKTKEDVAKFEKDLEKAPLYLRQAYKKGGFEAYNKAVQEYNEMAERWNRNVQEAIAIKKKDYVKAGTELGPYIVSVDTTDKKNVQYSHDIARYIRDNPDKEKTLLTFGYTPQQISDAKEFNKQYLGIGINSYEERIKQYFKEQGWKYTAASDIYSLRGKDIEEYYKHQGEALDVVYKEGVVVPMSAATYVERYCADRGYKVNLELLPRWWAGLHGEISETEAKLVEQAKQEYIDKYGYGAVSASFLGEWGPAVFAPIRVVSPEVEFKDLTMADWVMGGVQLAVILSPFKVLPKVPAATTGRILQTSAGIGSTYLTASQWSSMTPAERTIAITIDTLLLAPALISGAKYIQSKGDVIGTQAKNLIKNNDTVMAETIKTVRQLYGDVTGNWLESVYGSQKQLIEALVKQQKKASAKNNTAANNAINNLKSTVDKYTKSLDKNLQYDMPPKTYESIKNIGDNIVSHTKDIVDDLIPPKSRLKTLTNQLNAAQKALDDAKAKNPLKTHMWADELFSVLRIQNDIANITGNTGLKYTRLMAKLKDEINSLRRMTKEPEYQSSKPSIKARMKIKADQLRKITADYHDYIKSLRLEYKKGSEVSTGTGGSNKLLTKLDTKQSSRLQQELRRKGMDTMPRTSGGGFRSIPSMINIDAVSPIRLAIPDKIIKEIQSPGDMTEAQTANLIKSIYGEDTAQELNQDIENITDAFNQQLQESQTKTLTDTQVKNLIDESIKQSMKEQTEIAPATKPLEQLKIDTKTKQVIKPPRLKEPSKKARVILPPEPDSPDQKKRQAVKESLGAVTYRRGELNGKDVWHVFYVDGNGTTQRTVILGPAPLGATVSTGKGSASATLKRIRGKKVPNFRYVEDTGASDTIITTSGGKISITFTGNITGDKGRISQGMPRISGGRGRITPRMPKLR